MYAFNISSTYNTNLRHDFYDFYSFQSSDRHTAHTFSSMWSTTSITNSTTSITSKHNRIYMCIALCMTFAVVRNAGLGFPLSQFSRYGPAINVNKPSPPLSLPLPPNPSSIPVSLLQTSCPSPAQTQTNKQEHHNGEGRGIRQSGEPQGKASTKLADMESITAQSTTATEHNDCCQRSMSKKLG